MGFLNVQQDAADFDLVHRFRLDNLGVLLTAPDGTEATEARISVMLWPGYTYRVSRYYSKTGKSSLRLALYLLPGDMAFPPLSVNATVTVQSLSGDIVYSTQSPRRPSIFEQGRAIIGTLLTQKMYEASERMQHEDAVSVLVTLRPSNEPNPRSKPTLDLIHRVLTAQPISNTRFVVFSRRDSFGRLSSPRSFYANMKDLASTYERSESLLNVESMIEGFELQRGSCLSDYNLACEYTEYDSDFEPDEDEDDEDGDMVVVRGSGRDWRGSRASARRPARLVEPLIASEESITRESSQDRAMQMRGDEEAQGDMISSTTSFDMVDDKHEERSDLHTGSTYDGTTIVLLGTASKTWEALLYYLYTGIITFSPLRPRNATTCVDEDMWYHADGADEPAKPSCRSIYRLATKLELHGLRRIALQYLQSQLTPQTLLTEVFSEFTARYAEVKEMELALVVQYWDILKSSSAFKEKMVEVTSGKVPHAAEILSEIMLRVSAKQA
ncbi:hypothetical protein WOLCODRAFT_135535 [Wolfiporia cocos MD-104 SS10]|uniref:BTB domain-containing protein n=1 Tax=Wolfiporia cocos (strain MD-104) TaxID=742152 RepID=A0A2H3IVZ3_WOLCO|nr:hypothetical protein WOLCODRAFT_135535 [Wolfiporia cocos MD-104 SS10]